MAVTIGAFEAKTHFSELLVRAANGETITVAKRGIPVAQLGPVATTNAQADALAAVNEMRAARSAMRLDGLSVKDLLSEGRR